MANERKIVPDTPVEASANLSTKQYYAVYINSDNQLVVSTNTTPINGILQDKPAAAARAGAMRSLGMSKVELGGTVNEGDTLGADSSGKAVAIDRANVTDRFVLGTSRSDGISGQVGSVELNIGYIGG